MSLLGYAYLHAHLKLTAFEPVTQARLGAVTRVTVTANGLLVPAQVAGKTQTLLDHVLFALKHEGVNLQVLAQALPKVPAHDLVVGIHDAPTGAYIRVACFLWEFFNGTQLQGLPVISGPTVDVFDASRYITTKGTRNARWRVNFNGLGSLSYCVTVQRTPAIEALLAADILSSAQRFVAALAPMAAERAMSWAYLHETQSSFAIEFGRDYGTNGHTQEKWKEKRIKSIKEQDIFLYRSFEAFKSHPKYFYTFYSVIILLSLYFYFFNKLISLILMIIMLIIYIINIIIYLIKFKKIN
jgi:hypothetical protein